MKNVRANLVSLAIELENRTGLPRMSLPKKQNPLVVLAAWH